MRGHRLLLLMLAIAFFWGMWTESFDRLWQAQFLTGTGLPDVGGLSAVVWIGMLAGAAMVIGIVVTQVAVKLIVPLQSVWVNRTIEDSSVGATVLSIVNQSDAIGQVTGGPAIGAVGSSVGLRPALALYGRAVARHDRDSLLETAPADR